MMSDYKELFKVLKYEFKHMEILERALTHRSIPGKNNERLEFLGDAILGFIIAGELYHRYPKMREGDLSRVRSTLVNRESLVKIAKKLKIGEYLRLGAGELKSGGQHRLSILADAMEAIIGAVYMDSGIEVCREIVLQWYDQTFDDLSNLTPTKDAKSALQEWLQAHKFPLPTYEAKTSGAAHSQIFHVTCQVEGLPHITCGESSSRRKAEQQAAERYLDLLNE